jgi:GT2 family glycosyltransferase
MPPIVVVILNWNGAADTVACLESLSKQTSSNVHLVVVDNGSEDDSIARIKGWASNHHAAVEVIENGANLGFAAGSNVGIRHALDSGAESVLLLNNDTVLAPDAVSRLVAFLSEHPDYVAVTGQIRYADRPVIWNCGGELTWFGSRRYLFSEQTVESTPQDGWRRITFITGCAALIRTSVFAQHGLFTERFFFGEEDYEFSLRLKRAQCRIAVCFGAVIQHKVGSSIDRAAPPTALGRYYVYYLNRFIDMKDYYPRPIWWLWRWFSLAFVLPRLKLSRGLSWRGLALLGRRLIRDSARLEGVSRQRFEVATRSGLEAL